MDLSIAMYSLSLFYYLYNAKDLIVQSMQMNMANYLF